MRAAEPYRLDDQQSVANTCQGSDKVWLTSVVRQGGSDLLVLRAQVHSRSGRDTLQGGPAILEISVPAWIMKTLYTDPIAAGLERSGEIRFDPESGLNELRAEWHNLEKRVIPL